MIPRAVLDIDYPTLAAGLAASFRSSSATPHFDLQPPPFDIALRRAVVCLSVRSGFDAVLSAVRWPVGSEILMSAVTISAMAQIVREHGLVPIPLDVDPQTLEPSGEQLEQRITPRTRAVLVAHLFGSRIPLCNLAAVAHQHGLAVWEDAAQAYAADGWTGDSSADISFFSFGLIKAQTALGGAVMSFRDAELAQRCMGVMSDWPTQSTAMFRGKAMRAGLLRMLCHRWPFSMVTAAVDMVGGDFDRWLSNSVRGFPAAQLFEQLRRQPNAALISLLRRRLARPDRRWIEQKTRLASEYRHRLPAGVVLGSEAAFPAHWVLPIVARNPEQLRARLYRQGYDATVRASHMCVVPAAAEYPQWDAPQVADWLSRVLYLPLHPALRTRDLEKIAATVHMLEMRPQPTGPQHV